jgi:hypothetical protein
MKKKEEITAARAFALARWSPGLSLFLDYVPFGTPLGMTRKKNSNF